MKKKTITVLAAAAGLTAVLAAGGMFAADTVMAAEEIAALADSTVLQSTVNAELAAVHKNIIYDDASCTLMLPVGYVASEETPGMYLSERHPVDSSNIYYTVSENVDRRGLEEAVDSGEYREAAERKFKEAYGEEAKITAYSAEKGEISGCPSYKIELSCKVGDMQMDQLVYMIAADHVYTITYSQSADDEKMEEFEESAETIRVVFKEDAETVTVQP